jgi:transposase
LYPRRRQNQDGNPFVGIDVSKARLDIGAGAVGEFWQAANDEGGIRETLRGLSVLQPALVAVESTGGLELPLVSELCAARIPVALVKPGRVREFAKALGPLAKTDKLDVHLLARFGEAAELSPTLLPDEAVQKLWALVSRPRQPLEKLVAERNRPLSTRLSLRAGVQAHIGCLLDQLEVAAATAWMRLLASPIGAKHDAHKHQTDAAGTDFPVIPQNRGNR